MSVRRRRTFASARIVRLVLTGLSAGLLLSATSGRNLNSTEGTASITVLAGHRASFRIPRTIFGTFLEPIGSSVFGGVSAQLLDNSSLEAYPATPENIEKQFSGAAFRESTRLNVPLPWLPLHRDGRRYEPRSGYAANSNSYLYIMGLPGREVGIRQSVYLPVERETAYVGVVFALASEGAVTLSVSFRSHNVPDDILASTELGLPEQHRWVKLRYKLKLPAGAVPALTPVDFAVAVKDGGRVSLDEIRLYPADSVRGLDPDVIQFAKNLNTPLLRFGGNFSSGYHWQDGVGPIDDRPTRCNEAWGIPEYNEFGTDEFMDFCDRIGALPQICLNLGSGSVDEARAWVEYSQGSPETVQGRRRTANGHSAPWRVGAWELGNELYDHTQLGWYTPQAYAERYLAFFQRIHSLVPSDTRILATGGEIDSFKNWNGALLERAGPQLQYVTTHLVADLEDTQNRSADRDTVIAADLALPVGVGRELKRFQAQIQSFPSTRDRVKLSYSEWMFRSPEGSSLPNYDNMGGAVIAAGWFNMLARHADFIPLANMTGLVEFAGIHKRRGRPYVTPQYWVLYLYAKYAGEKVIESTTRVASYDVHKGQVFAPEIPNVPFLDVLATMNLENGRIALFVVNRNPKVSQLCHIHIGGFKSAPNVRILSLAAPSLLTFNSEEHPDAVRPVESQSVMASDGLEHAFPAGSLSVLLFSERR
ncbi:MAG TPA: alpha-L-arabinofuranosidase C-terminal domain-containing protein [Bryobacteraceae bacterium]|nr:alpha-L-arabinofuranosidase C-terminal domain-containing protein [Bryobacteraceae bacterium]